MIDHFMCRVSIVSYHMMKVSKLLIVDLLLHLVNAPRGSILQATLPKEYVYIYFTVHTQPVFVTTQIIVVLTEECSPLAVNVSPAMFCNQEICFFFFLCLRERQVAERVSLHVQQPQYS